MQLNNLLGILLIARRGRNTRIVLTAERFKLSLRPYSAAPAKTITKSRRFHESARYVPRPYTPIAIILIVISNEKKAKIKSSKSYKETNRKSRIINSKHKLQ